MIECLNKECKGNKDNKCTDKIVNLPSSLTGCPERIINYEEEYKKLKAENEEYKQANIRLGNFRKEQEEKIKELEKELEEAKKLANEKFDEVRKLKAENKKILVENAELKELKASYEDSMETMNEALIELNKEKGKILSFGDKKIEELEASLQDKDNYIKELQISHNTIEKENCKLRENLKTKDNIIDKAAKSIKTLADML